MGTRASWRTPACWPGGRRARLARAGEHAHPSSLLVPTPGSSAPLRSRAKGHSTCQTALPRPRSVSLMAASQAGKGLTIVLCVAPASHCTDLAIHQGLASSWEAHGLDVFCKRDDASPVPPGTNLCLAAASAPDTTFPLFFYSNHHRSCPLLGAHVLGTFLCQFN